MGDDLSGGDGEQGLEKSHADGSSEASPANEDEVRIRHALIGLLYESYAVARTGVSVGGRVTSLGWSLAEPIAGPLLEPVRKPTQALVDRWVRIGRTYEEQGRENAREIMRAPVDEIVTYLRGNPEVEALVKQQAEALLAQLREDVRVQSLVRAQGDDYIEHLKERPEAVQQLVRGQSVGMVNELLGVLREQATVADAFLERLVRNALRRTPRDQVPGPSSMVRMLADNPRLRSDE
jgi:hypothetical protein